MRTRIALHATAEALRSYNLAVAEAPFELQVDGGRAGSTRIVCEETEIVTRDGNRLAEVARVVHSLDKTYANMHPEYVFRANTCASLLCLVDRPPSATPVLFAKVPVLAEDVAAEDLYPRLLAWATFQAQAIGHYFAPGSPNMMEFLNCGKPPPVEFFGLRDAVDDFDGDAFRLAQEGAASRGMLSSWSENGVTVEFPWDPEAVTWRSSASAAREHGRTSLLTITRTRHLFLGSGLRGLLRLPISLDQEPRHVATLMNRWEFESMAVPPTFGAWVMDEQFRDSIAFTCFFPAAFTYPLLPRQIVNWMHKRVEVAQQWLAINGFAT